MSWLNRIVYYGTDKVEERYIRKKLVVANVMGVVVVLCLALPFVFISLIFFPVLTYWPVLGVILASLAILIFNKQGLHLLGRGIIAIVPVALSCFFGAEVMSVNDEVILSSYLLTFTLAFMPCLIFDVKKETSWFIVFNLIGIILISNFDYINGLLETPVDDDLIRNGWLNTVSFFMALTVGFSNFIVLSLINIQSDEKVKKYIEEAKEKNEELVASEGMLQGKLQELEENKKKDEQDAWMATGLAKTGDILRDNRADIKAMSTDLIQFLSKYLKVSNATMFISEHDESGKENMSVVATYAFDREKLTNTSITFDEGLLGQSWKEGTPIHLKEVPADYVKINSGLGEAVPTNILIIPFKDSTEQKVEAILELAAFHSITPLHIGFLEKISESVAGAIKSNKSAALTDKLLQEAQQMGQELREQEEELRQNAEEMMATQEELEKQLQDSAQAIKVLKEQLAES